MTRILLTIIFVLCCNVLIGEDLVESRLKEEVQRTTDPSKLHELYKALGNHYTAIGKKEEAELAYKHAKNWELSKDLKIKLDEIKNLADANKLNEAIKELRTLEKQYPQFIELNILLARYLGWNQDFVQANTEIDHVLQKEPENWEALLIKANLLRWDGKPEEAITIYKKLLSQKEDFDAQLGLTWSYLALKEFSEARREFQQLHPVETYQKKNYQELAEAIQKQTQESATESLCNNLETSILETKDPWKLAYLYKRLGDCFSKNGQIKKARSAYIKALSYPYLSEANRMPIIKYLGEAGFTQEAIEELKKITVQDPENMEARLLLARYLGLEKQFSQSQKEVDLVLQKMPEDRKALLVKANTLRWQGKYTESIALYQSILAKEENFDARLGLAWAELEQRHFNEAIKEFSLLDPKTDFEKKEKKQFAQAIEQERGKTVEFKRKEKDVQEALELALEKKYDQALQAINAILTKNPDDPTALLAKADILRWSKHFRDSIPVYFEILKNKEDFHARIGLAWAYLNLGHRDEAQLNFALLMPENESEKKDVKELAENLQTPHVAEKENCEEIEHQLKVTKDHVQICLLNKKWADCLANQEREKEAVAAYQKVLQLPCPVFSVSERLEMINYLGTHETIRPAIEQLEKILSNDPKNLKARILYARFLGWDKQFKEAIQQIDSVLAVEPENIEALLIKANVFRWDQKYQEALPIYLKILAKGENFDARLGLAWDYLNLEQFDKAEESIALLKPTLAYQIKEKKELKEGLEKERIEAPKRELQKAIAKAYKYVEMKRFGAALTQIFCVLQQHPNNIEVQVTVSKILSWAGYYQASLAWTRHILMQDPCNVQALITRGNVWRWKLAPGSYALYNRALCIDPNSFYAKLGLIYALAARTWVNSAYDLACTLNPKECEEKNDYADLLWNLPWCHALNFRFYRYTDSDDIDTMKFSLGTTAWVNDWQMDLLLRYVDDTQPTIVPEHPTLFERSTTAQVDFFRSVNPNVDLGGGIGYANISGDSHGDFVVGNVRSNIFTPCGNFSVGSIYDVYTETAAALFFKIRTWTNYISYVNYLSGFTTIGASYYYVKYSDANHSNRAWFYIRQKYFDKGCIKLFTKYDVIYMDFESQPFSIFAIPSLASGGHGYFDPKNFVSNQLTLQSVFESKRVYCTGYPFIGYVTYRLLGLHYNGIFYGGGLIFGCRFDRRLMLEINAESAKYELTHLTYTYTALAGWVKLAF